MSLCSTSQTSCMHLVHLSCSSLSCEGQLRGSSRAGEMGALGWSTGLLYGGSSSMGISCWKGSCWKLQSSATARHGGHSRVTGHSSATRPSLKVYLPGLSLPACPVPILCRFSCIWPMGTWEACSGVSSLLHPFSRSEILLRVKVFPICCWSGTVFRNKSDFFEVEI